MFDAVVISDLHLGSDNCRAKALVQFLEAVRDGRLGTKRLFLNGDVFDSIDFRRLKKQHWKVLSLLRKLSDEIEITWINGNHDGPADIVSHLLGVEVVDEVALVSGDQRVLLLHGHRFDEFIERYPVTSKLADGVYRLLQWLDKSHTVARQAKSKSKIFLRCVEKVQQLSVQYARKRGFDIVCCGHTHHPVVAAADGVTYVNSGCWTERTCHYLTISDGVVELRAYNEETEVFHLSEAGSIGLVASIISHRPTPTK